MSPTGRRFAAAVLLGLALFAAAPVPAAQDKTVDLGGVESAADYRSEPPAGPGFVGSDAAVLNRGLARINKALGTDLRPDHRLALLARWVYENLGPEPAMPSQAVMDVLVHRLGLPEPLPHLLVTQAPDAPRAANVVSSRLARLFDVQDYSHIGGVAEREEGGIVVVIVVSRRHLTLAPVPRRLDGPWMVKLEGRVAGDYRKPELAHTLPDGRTRMEPLGTGQDFSRTVALGERGRHRLEILAEGPDGPNVLANFPVFVGVPVDSTAAAGAPRGKAVRAGEARDVLLELINADRIKAGLAPLAPDPELDEVALRHSEDMRENDFVAHVSPGSGTTEERLTRAGVVTDLAAENVGKGYGPEEIHRGFMESPGHRGAILLADATHVGIGVAPKKEGDLTTYFATELFIRRIPPLGADAKTVFRMELDGLRESAGLGRLEEDPALAEIAEVAARSYFLDPSLSRDDVMSRLTGSIEKAYRKRVTMQIVFSVVGSLEDGARQAAADPRVDRARRVGIGIAQGTRAGHPPNAIALVLIYAD